MDLSLIIPIVPPPIQAMSFNDADR